MENYLFIKAKEIQTLNQDPIKDLLRYKKKEYINPSEGESLIRYSTFVFIRVNEILSISTSITDLTITTDSENIIAQFHDILEMGFKDFHEVFQMINWLQKDPMHCFIEYLKPEDLKYESEKSWYKDLENIEQNYD